MSPGKRPRRKGSLPPKKKNVPTRKSSPPSMSNMRPSSRKDSIAPKFTHWEGRSSAGDCGNKKSSISRDGNPAHQIFLFRDGLCPNRKRVEHAKSYRVAKRLVLPMPQIALAENLHANDSLSGSAHFAENADDRDRVGIHVRPDRIDAHQIHFDPGRFGRGTQSLNGMA